MLYISLRQYEYVCAIGRHGSLSAAAQVLNVSQPALSTALTRVETRLGYPLFIRRRGAAMALTPQGRAFVEEAEALLIAATRLEGAQQGRSGSSRLRLGCFVDLAPFLLAPALHLIRDHLPDSDVSCVADSFEGLIAGLVEGQIDLAITYELGMDAGFARDILYDSTPHALMPPTHEMANAKSVSLADLENHPLILSQEGLSAQHILGLFRRHNLRPVVAHRAASLEIQRSLAAHGEGIAVSYANPPGHRSYDNKRLVSVPICDTDARESVVLAQHGPGSSHNLVARASSVLKNGLRRG